MPPPEHSAFSGDTGTIARAVQAYAFSLINGGTIEDAERAAGKISSELDMPQIAAMARGARQAAAAFGARRVDTTYKPGGRQYSQYESGLAAVAQEGGGNLVATVTYYYSPRDSGAASGGAPEKSSAVQVDIPLGTPYAKALQLIEEAVLQATEGDDNKYPGELRGFSVRTIVEI